VTIKNLTKERKKMMILILDKNGFFEIDKKALSEAFEGR
jgi:hypothetical protein